MFECFKDKDFLKRFVKISMPVMLAAFISFIANFLDNLMVGGVSNEVVSGVYAANQTTYIFNLAAYGLLEGAGIFIEQYNGSKDISHIKQCFRYKVYITIIFLLIAIPLAYFFGKDLMYVYCHSDENCDLIMKEGINYFNIVILSFIPYCITCLFTTTLRETGNTKIVLYSSFVAVGANFFFNLLFIVGLNMGGSGAAIATVIARILELLFTLIFVIFKKYPYFRNAFDTFKVEKALFIDMTKKGFLLFINEIGFGMGMVLQTSAYAQRNNVLAANSIISTISNIFGILITGLSVSIGVMVGSSLGRDDFEKAKDDNKKLNQLGFWMSIIVGIILISLSKFIPMMFTKVDESQKLLATKLLIIYASLLWANCFSITAYYTLRVGGKTFLTLLLDTGLMFAMYIPVAWILAMCTDLDLLYLYLIVRSLDLVKASIGLILVNKGSWVKNITIKKELTYDENK